MRKIYIHGSNNDIGKMECPLVGYLKIGKGMM